MKKDSKIPTIIGLILLTIGLVAGVFLINSRQVFKLGANVEATPKNVRVTNITDTSFTVTWTTDIASSGFIKWGTSQSSLSKVSLEESSTKDLVHSATIIGAQAGSNVYFKINSDGQDYDNQGIAWQQNTLTVKAVSNQNLIASGSILKSDASTPATAIVYLTVNGETLSALSSQGGTYVIPLSNYVSNVIDTTPIELSVQGGLNGSSQAVIYPTNINAIPTIVLGRSYDFRTLTTTNSDNLPESSLTIPESVAASSRFEVNKSDAIKQESANVKIESIEEGEIITTTNPEFFGTGPTGSTVEILVESELQSDTLNIGSNGRWNWTPPNNLEPGEHKLTLRWRDASGILRTITRTFIVSAAEGPAFEATPSASLTPNPTAVSTLSASPTASSSSTPAAVKSPTATLPPVPETGSLTHTIGLFIMGIGILLSSIFIWNKQHA